MRVVLLLFVASMAFIPANGENNASFWEKRSVPEVTCDGTSTRHLFDQKIHDEAMALSYNRKMYRVMCNLLSLQSLSLRYSGKEVTSKNDLRAACPTANFKWKTGVFSAFGRQTKCQEDSTGPTRVKCTGDWTMKNKKKYKNDGGVTYIWTDGEQYTLHLDCVDGQLHWILSSTIGGKVERNVKALVFRKIKKLGFDPENAVNIPHDQC